MQLGETLQGCPSLTSRILQPDLPLQTLDWLKILRRTTMTQHNWMLDPHLIVPLRKKAIGTLCSSSARETAEATIAGDIALELNHALLVAGRVLGRLFQHPLEVLVGVIGNKVGRQDAEALAVLGDLCPVALDVLQIAREVGVAALKDFAVELGAHDGLEVDVLGPGLFRLVEDKVGGALDGAQERAHLGRVGGQEVVVGNVEDGAEAAAAELGELVDAQHLHVRLGTALAGEPLLELDHLDVLEADAGVNLAVLDGLGDVHAAADGRVVFGGQAVVRGELVNLDLAELADVADALALERAEVGRDARLLEVDDASEGLVEEAANRGDGEVASLGLRISY